MFGLIVAGRLVQTDFQPVDENKFLINIADIDNINHIVIFLTGATPLPLGTAGAVYFSWPDPQNPSKWQFLGHMSNSKPSAIFKISQLKKLHEMEAMESMMLFGTSDVSHIAQIGVSVEPEESVMAQVPASTNDVETTYVFGKKMLENFVNFASSFSVRQCEMQPNPIENYVPMSTLNTWFTNFERRLQQNPTFWK